MRQLTESSPPQTDRRSVAPREEASKADAVRLAREPRFDAALVLGLQRTLGNRQVQGLLPRTASDARPSPGPTRRRSTSPPVCPSPPARGQPGAGAW